MFKKNLTVIFFISLLIIIIYNRSIIRPGLKIPLDTFTLNKFIYLIIAFWLFFISLLIVLNYNNKIDLLNYFNNSIEKQKSNLDFIILFLDSKYINFHNIYKYLYTYKYLLIYLYICMNYVIRIMIFIVFVIDVFYFHYIYYFYNMLPLMLVPLIFQILFYLLKRYYEIKCNNIQYRIQPFIYTIKEKKSSGVIPLKDYLYLKYIELQNNIPTNASILLDPDFINQWQTMYNKKLDYKKTIKQYEQCITFYTMYFSVVYTFENQKLLFNKIITFIIRLGYFIGWSYIFYISDPIHFLLIIEFFINCIQLIEEPFSGLLL